MEHFKPNVILVEDDDDLRETIVESLAIHGIAVTAVGSGCDFYQALDRQPFAAALIDLGLPDLDGYELVTYLRQNSTVKIIVMTARTALADRVKGYATGADLYLVKPVDMEELAAAIVSIVARKVTSSQSVTVAGCWVLERSSWQFITPEGDGFQLGRKEFHLLVELAESGGEAVERTAILAAVYEKSDEQASRALDVLISRLRTRFHSATGANLPLQTVPGFGFFFTAPLRVR